MLGQYTNLFQFNALFQDGKSLAIASLLFNGIPSPLAGQPRLIATNCFVYYLQTASLTPTKTVTSS